MSVKVIHLNTTDVGGGAEKIAMNLVKFSHAESCLVVKEKRSNCEKVIELPKLLRDHIYNLIRRILHKINFKKDLKNILFLSESLNATRKKLLQLTAYKEAAIIHLHNLHRGYFDINDLLSIASKKVIFWTLHDMWPLTGGEVHTFGDEGFKTGKSKTPFFKFYPLDNPVVDRRHYFLERKKSLYGKLGQRLVFICVSKWMEENIKSSYVYSKENEVKLIYNGIDTDLFINRSIRNWKVPRILFFNSSSPFKGSQLFISSLKDISFDYDLNIIGKKIEGVNIKLHKERITDSADLIEIYNNSDILIYPSLADNFPLTILEAMSCGVCVVASNVGGIPEALDENCGYLFKSSDPYDLQRQVNNSLENLNITRNKGMLASERVKRFFTLSKMINEYDELYYSYLKILE